MTLRPTTFAVVLLIGIPALSGCAEPLAPPPDPYGAPGSLERQSHILDELGCDPLVPTDCGFPFPSDVYRIADPRMETGFHIHVPDGTVIPTSRYAVTSDLSILHQSDGFSAGQQAAVRLPGATPAGLPDAEHIGDSLLADSPTVLLDAETGERIPHWAELDMRSQDSTADVNDSDTQRRALLIRPAQRLRASRRYIVAVRDVVDAGGMPIAPSPVFEALRDGTESTLPTVTLRRDLYEDIFTRLAAAGVSRDTLQIAWDFSTASVANDTRRLRHMRDVTLASLGAGASPEYIVDSVEDDPPSDTNIRRIVRGHVTVPLYLTSTEVDATMTIGADGLPVRNGSAQFPFVVLIPRSSVPGPWPIVQFGHGLFGSAGDVIDRRISTMAAAHGAVFVAHDWLGLTSNDLYPLADILVQGDVSRFAIVPDRGQQAMLNAMCILRMMRYGLVDDPATQPDGVPTIDPSRTHFFGGSLGGIYGATYMAISPDIVRGALGVPGQSFDLLLPRSEAFDQFLIALRLNWAQKVNYPLFLGVMQMAWDRVEPTGYSHHLRDDPLPGSPQKEIFMLSALGDHLVSNYGSLVMARSIGLPQLEPKVRTRYGLESVTGPTTGEAWLELDFGLAPVPIGNLPARDGSDPHSAPFGLTVVQDMVYEFLSTGIIDNLCTGTCDPD